jgi:uracil-DNA glycosylase
MTAYNDGWRMLLAHVEHLKDQGVTNVPVSPQTLQAWRAARRKAAARPAAAPAAPPPAPRPAAARPTPAAPPVAAMPAPADAPKRPRPEVEAGLKDVAVRVSVCTRCRLCESRTRAVPGQGNPETAILFVGEGPGEEEDRQGLAFVGAAGQLLTRMIVRMGLQREDVFIANVVKCRPPGNRTPEPDEMEACLPYLREQIALLRPKVIVALGATAVRGLTGVLKPGITRLRGQWMTFAGVPLMPTFHPSYLLRGGGDEKARYWEVWEDMKQVLAALGRDVPPDRR